MLQNQPQLPIETDLRFERIKHLLPQQFGDERLLGVNRRWRFYRYYSGNLPLGLKIAGGSEAEQDFSGIGEEPFAWEFDASSTSIWTAAKVSEAFRWCLAGEWYCPRRWPREVHLWCPWWWDTFQAHLHHLFDTWNLTLPAHPEFFSFPPAECCNMKQFFCILFWGFLTIIASLPTHGEEWWFRRWLYYFFYSKTWRRGYLALKAHRDIGWTSKFVLDLSWASRSVSWGFVPEHQLN